MRRRARFLAAAGVASTVALVLVYTASKSEWMEWSSSPIWSLTSDQDQFLNVSLNEGQVAECGPILESVRRRSESFRSCAQASDCTEVRSPYVDFNAINKANYREFEERADRIPRHCRSNVIIESLAFGAAYGVKIGCEQQQCTIRRITADERYETLRQELTRQLSEQAE